MQRDRIALQGKRRRVPQPRGAAPALREASENGAADPHSRGAILLAGPKNVARETLRRRLAAEGFAVECASDGEAALALVREHAFALVILDLALPDLSGFEVCRRLRATSEVPILVVAPKRSEADCVLSFEIGADDFVSRPVAPAEIVARVRARQRRRAVDDARSRGVRELGALRLDLHRHEATLDGRPLRLTPSEFRILSLLSTEPDRPFDRREIIRTLWQTDFVGDERSCDIHITRLRRKIERDPSRPERLVTVRSVGYKLCVL